MFKFSKVMRSICRCLQRISPAVAPAISVLSQVWLGVIYYADSAVAGNSLLVENAVSLYKEEFDRKKAEMGQRVKDIMFQAEKM